MTTAQQEGPARGFWWILNGFTGSTFWLSMRPPSSWSPAVPSSVTGSGCAPSGPAAEKADVSTLASAALGLLALLIAFSFSMALSRYERRRDMVLEEANAIGSTANFTLMLPPSAQRPILSLLREYTAVRVALGVPYDSQKMKKDIARSLDIQARLWQQAAAVATAEPQSLPAYCLSPPWTR
jgi:hypothetical protein